MSGWPLIPLGEVFEIARGGSPRPIDAFITDSDDGINWVSISDASDSSKYIERTKRRIRPEGASRSRTVYPGDFLLTNSMSFGRPYIMRTTGCIHDGWLALGKKRDGIDHDFFFHLLGSDAVYSEFARLAAGVTVKNLNIELVKGVKVPVPPLPEQRRIAEVLDRAETLRAQRRQALAQLDALAEALFLDMFGEPNSNPKQWPVATIKSLGVVKTGRTPPGSLAGMFDGPIPFITPGDLEAGLPPKRSLTEAGVEQVVACRAGALLVCCIGATIGKSDIAQTRSAFNQQINAVEWGKQIDDEFGLASMRLLKAQIVARGTSTTLPILKKSSFETVSLQVPPMDLQRKFSCIVNAIDNSREFQLHAEVALNTLFTSLQHRAFRGEL